MQTTHYRRRRSEGFSAKKTSRCISPVAVLLILSALGIELAHGASQANDGWNNLKHVTKKRSYAVIRTDGRCSSGWLITSDHTTIVLNSSQQPGPVAQPIRIAKTDVLRVSDTP